MYRAPLLTNASIIDIDVLDNDNGYRFEIEGTDDIIDVDYTVIDEAIGSANSPLLLAAPSIEEEVWSDPQSEATADAEAPGKKQYDTPFLPRALFLKKLREEGKLKPREPRTKAVKPAAEAKPPRERSPAEIRAIRRHFYFARKAA